jgi:ubiquinone/menaquinone biosynthesis C-methylase UbiE
MMASELDPHGVESRALLEAVDFDKARVLEVGSGDGRLAFRYANASAFVVGIEPEAKELAAARSACPPELRRRVSFVQATALALPFSSDTFDIAVLAWSL